MNGHIFDPTLSAATGAPPGPGQYQFHPTTLDVASLKGSRASLLNEVGKILVDIVRLCYVLVCVE